MPLCETCQSIDFVQLTQSAPRVTSHIYEDNPVGLGLFYFKFERDIRTSTDFVLYHGSLADLFTSARLCDLCRLVTPPVAKVMRNRRKREQYYDLKRCQLWACRSEDDGVLILGISKKRWNKAFVLCHILFRVDGGKHNEALALRFLFFTYTSCLCLPTR